MVPFGARRQSEVTTHPHMKGRSAKQGKKEEKQEGNHVEGGRYVDDGKHGDTPCLAPHAVREAKDTGQCLTVVGRQVKLKSSPPLR